MNSLEYERQKYKIIKGLVDDYKAELNDLRLRALDMPIETDNGFNVERERLIDDIDEKLAILRRHEADPYFAKLTFKSMEDDMAFNGYLGRVSIGDVKSQSDEKIVDWRAPIADLYYNGRLGQSEYEAHGEKHLVDLQLKRQVSIKDNQVESIFDFEDAVSNDEFLVPFLTQSADNRLKNIVATIQGEQNDIIRYPALNNIVVQGVAGSGKTTVALHRLSYIIYNYKNILKPEQLLIISPNELFMSYISGILQDLDADKSNSFSINKIIADLLGTNYEIMTKHAQYRYLVSKKISTNYLSYKTSLQFADALERYLADVRKQLFYKPLVIKGVEVLSADDVYTFFDDSKETNITKLSINGTRKMALTLSISGELRNKANNNVDKVDIDLQKKWEIKRLLESGNIGYLKQFNKSNYDIINMYTVFLKNINQYTDYAERDILQKYSLENLKKKHIAYDDFGALLYLVARVVDAPYYSSLRCVFVDEAQDMSELMYAAMKRLFANAKFSIFGDIAQGIYSYEAISNWDAVMNILGNCELKYLNRSYRTSIEIMQSANEELDKLGYARANNVVRHGEEVETIVNANIKTFLDCLDRLNAKYSHTAIIVKDDAELEEAKVKLAELNLTLLDENNYSYGDAKNTIMTVQTAKGLEFDSVIIYNISSYQGQELDLKQLYVAKTRALHKLVIMDLVK